MFYHYLIIAALSAVLFLRSGPVSAQSAGRKTVQQSSLWIWGSAQLRAHRYFGLQAEAILRLSDFQRNQQHEFLVGADIYATNNIVITPAGYDFFLNYIYGRLPAAVKQNEHRLWHQILYRNNIGRMGIGLRLRAEENWRERKSKSNDGSFYMDGYTFRPRIRPRFQINIALNHRNMMIPKTVFLSVWDEMYIPVGAKLTYHLPDENRAHIGIGYRLNDWSSVTAGYMHQLIIRSDGLQAESNHTLVMQAVFTPDIRKKR